MAPDFDAFSKAARAALCEITCCEANDPALAAFDARGQAFDFYVDGNVDSLDMLDITFDIEKRLGIKIGLESITNDDKPMTVQNLYDSIRN